MTIPPAHAPVLWFTGLSGAGKSTLAKAVFSALTSTGTPAELLDADLIRPQLWPELGFSQHDREQSVRRLGSLAALLSRHGIVPLVAAMSPGLLSRQSVRATVGTFIEIYVDAPLPLCRQRDPAGIYRRFSRGEISHISGLDEPYEPPQDPEVHCQTAQTTVDQCVAQILRYLKHPLATQRSKHSPT